MKIIYSDDLATHKRRCSGENWVNGKRCRKEITFRAVNIYGEIHEDIKVYCHTHRYQGEVDGQGNQHSPGRFSS